MLLMCAKIRNGAHAETETWFYTRSQIGRKSCIAVTHHYASSSSTSSIVAACLRVVLP